MSVDLGVMATYIVICRFFLASVGSLLSCKIHGESGEREEAAASSLSSADEGMTHMCSHVGKLCGWNLEFSQEL